MEKKKKLKKKKIGGNRKKYNLMKRLFPILEKELRLLGH